MPPRLAFRHKWCAEIRRRPTMGLEDHLHSLQGRYIQAPQWVRSLLGAGYAALPQSLRHGAAYSGFAAEAECADAARVSAAASEKLAATLNTALGLVPAF